MTSSTIPQSRWVVAETSEVSAAAYGSFLAREYLRLDASAFGMSMLEAKSLDPQQVFVLHAGYATVVRGHDEHRDECGNPLHVRGMLEYSHVGVFVGVEPSGIVTDDAHNVFSASGSAASITSGRLSFALGLVGPCYSLDTACSSALVALHACVITL